MNRVMIMAGRIHGMTANYWNDQKTGGGYIISGAPKAKDNFPLSSPVAIRFESPTEKMTTKDETGKSTPPLVIYSLFPVTFICMSTWFQSIFNNAPSKRINTLDNPSIIIRGTHD